MHVYQSQSDWKLLVAKLSLGVVLYCCEETITQRLARLLSPTTRELIRITTPRGVQLDTEYMHFKSVYCFYLLSKPALIPSATKGQETFEMQGSRLAFPTVQASLSCLGLSEVTSAQPYAPGGRSFCCYLEGPRAWLGRYAFLTEKEISRG